VNFSVYDIAGRRVLDSDFSNISAGTHTMVWDRTDNQGREVANGIYFYRVEAAGNVATGKLILVH
jgi:flagellar hook assembly protein FlgD